jgi:hypothetical protein
MIRQWGATGHRPVLRISFRCSPTHELERSRRLLHVVYLSLVTALLGTNKIVVVRNFLRLNALPRLPDLGLLVLRLILGSCLSLLRGWPRLSRFSRLVSHFPDPIHLG